MRPESVSEHLRWMASVLDASSRPSISKVSLALHSVLASVEEEHVSVTDGGGTEWAIANPGDHDWTRKLWAFTFGSTGTAHVLVWGNSADDALEDAAQYLREAELVGYFVSDENMASNYEEAKSELGPGADSDKIAEKAEQDLTHTEHGYIPSWEWTVDEAPPELVKLAKQASMEAGDEGGPEPEPAPPAGP